MKLRVETSEQMKVLFEIIADFGAGTPENIPALRKFKGILAQAIKQAKRV